MQPPDPLFDKRNLIRATLTAFLGMAAAACVMYAPFVPVLWRPALVIAGLGIAVFAAGVNIHLPTAPPVVSGENIATVNVNPPAEPSAPAVTVEHLPPPAITPAVKVPRARS